MTYCITYVLDDREVGSYGRRFPLVAVGTIISKGKKDICYVIVRPELIVTAMSCASKIKSCVFSAHSIKEKILLVSLGDTKLNMGNLKAAYLIDYISMRESRLDQIRLDTRR